MKIEVYHYNEEAPDTYSLQEFIEQLEGLRMTIPFEFRTEAKISFPGRSSCDMLITYEREETDIEKNRRLERKAANQRGVEMWERQQFEYLKLKYGE